MRMDILVPTRVKNFFQGFLPKKNHFIGIDIGAYQIKIAEVKIIDGIPEVISLRRYPSPPKVWTDQLEEESLVLALKEIINPQLKEAITCIGGEKLISRIVRLPQMSNKELDAAVKFELEKFVPIPVDQLITRQVRLEEINDSQEKGQNVLLLAAPTATVYQYYGIFSRAGLLVTAIDLQSFALWRLFGRTAKGTLAITDIGAETSHFVVVKDGLIQFIRLLPVGSNILTSHLMDIYGLDFPEAQQMKEEATVLIDSDQDNPGAAQISNVLSESLLEITKELHRSLEFCSTQENLPVEKLILSGGASKLKGLTGYLKDALKIPVEPGVPGISLPWEETFDPAYSVAIGLALREVVE